MGLKPTCKEVHQLVSESMDRPLTLIERVRKSLHLTVCEACTVFDRQMILIRRAMRHGPSDERGGAPPGPPVAPTLTTPPDQAPGETQK